MTVNTGDGATLTFTVTDGDTAIALGSGDVPVLGTPRLVAWCEAATVAALAPALEAGATSVGFRVEVDHLAPTAVGDSVDVVATVEKIDGRMVTLAVSASDGRGQRVGAGSIARVVVDRQQFVDRLHR